MPSPWTRARPVAGKAYLLILPGKAHGFVVTPKGWARLVAQGWLRSRLPVGKDAKEWARLKDLPAQVRN